MDPNTTLGHIIDAATDNDPNELMRAASDLAHWLDAGGFAPTDPRPISGFTGRDPQDEDES